MLLANSSVITEVMQLNVNWGKPQIITTGCMLLFLLCKPEPTLVFLSIGLNQAAVSPSFRNIQ